jgi:RHS repeat-associated protein
MGGHALSVLRRLVTVVSGIALASTSLVVASQLASATTPPQQAEADPGTRPDATSAVVAARIFDRQVEVTGATTETTRRWANPDGTFTDEVYAAPVRTRHGDDWVPVDTALTDTGNAVAPAATVGDVAFSDGGDTALASVSEGGVSVALSSDSTLPAPTIVGNSATYADVQPGVDLTVDATESGFEQSFVLKDADAAAAASQLDLPLTLTGVSPVATEGGIVFRDAQGNDRAFAGSARMWDATGRTAPVAVAVNGTGSSRSLVMTPDAGFLADPSLVFPVTVDPTVQLYRWRDSYIENVNTTANYYNNPYLKIGKRSSTTYVTYISFDMSSYTGKKIVDAYTYLGMTDSVTCSARTTNAYPVTTYWESTSVTWANHPTTDLGTVLASSTAAGGGPVGSTCQSNAWMELRSSDLTAKYQAWADNNSTNYGMSIRAADQTDTTAAKDFASGENGSWTPRVNITWESYPRTVAGRYVTPANVATDGTRFVPTTTPTLAGGTCDPDSDPVRIDFEVWDSTKSTLLQSSPSTDPTVASCATRQWTLPSALTNGTTYYWRARAWDGHAYSKSWSSWSPIVVDTTAPPTPTIAATTMTQNAWLNATAPAATNETFTFTATPTTDVAGYYYGIDEPNPTTYATSASAAISVDEGWHTVYVQTADKAGNRSSVAAFAFGYGHFGVTSPEAGSRSAQTFTLSGAANPNVGTLTWKRKDSTGAYVALTSLKDTSNNPVTQPITVTSGVAPTLSWDAATELGASGDGPVELMASVTETGAPGTALATRSVPVTFDRNDFGSVNATEDMGPGSVNLLTGNLQVSATDVSVDAYGSDLTMGRTFNSRDESASPNGPFGKGWVSSTPVSAANADYTSLAISGTVATLAETGGDTVSFTRPSTSSNTWTPAYGNEDLSLTYASTASPLRYDVKDLDGNVTGFTLPTGATAWVPTSVQQAGDSGSTTYSYETKTINGESVTRVTAVMAPDPGGLSAACSLSSPSAVVGCRSLKLTYYISTTTPPASGTFGAYPDRLQKVELIAYDPDATPAAMATTALAQYDYDSDGRLAHAWDPRLSALKTAYTYNANGQLATVTPPAEEAWTIAYAALSTEASTVGRVKTVSRPTLLVSPTTATTTVVYGVPVSGSGAPYDLSSTEVARWDQHDLATTATAVFPATTAATFGSGSLPAPTSYDRATVHYLNADGREVNTADPNGGISTVEHDGRGNVVRSLSAGNRQRALDRGATATDEAIVADALSSTTVYSPDGVDVMETFGPEHEIALAGSGGDLARARAHTVNTYDEGTTGGPWHLLTTTVAGARVAGEATDRASESRTTKTQYGTTTAAWTLAQPTASIVDAVTGGLNLTTRTSYSADGRVLTQTLPAGGTTTNTPSTRVTRYYSAGTGSGDTLCDGKPAWVNLVCSVGPGGQPTGVALPTTYTTYDMFNQPRVVTEKSGTTTLRTTTTTYDAGRPVDTTISTSTGTAVPTTETYYDPTTGRATETRSMSGSTVTARVTRVYNTLGQLTSYTDTDGNTSTTTYDVLGRPVTTNDGKGSQTWSYDGGSERRGLATQLVDSQAGTFAATYDVDGTPVVDWPNGLRSSSVVDESGSATSLSYAATSGCAGAECVVLSDSVHESVHGQWLDQSSTLSAQDYGYDAAGRLAEVDDTASDVCTVRRYTYDAGVAGNSDRTKLETFASADATCQTSSVTSTVNSTYDTADRITTTGTVYDTLGRTTTVPDGDALDSGALTVGYYGNDLVRSIAIAGGASKTYTLDVDAQRVRSWLDGAVTHTNHYDGDGDNPAWTQESATAWTRPIGGIAGDLAAIYDSATAAATLQLTNLHGDVVATTSTSSTALASTGESTEFGVPRGATGTRYGWLGGKQRAADTYGGIVLMGVRLYNPATGRFAQVDPVYGGSANSYDYANQEPQRSFDIDGKMVREGGGWNPNAWAFRVCQGNMTCQGEWWGLRGKMGRTNANYKIRCWRGVKGASQLLGYRNGISALNQVRTHHYRKAAGYAAGFAGTTGGMAAAGRYGRHAYGRGLFLRGASRLGYWGTRAASALASPLVGIPATALDYACR